MTASTSEFLRDTDELSSVDERTSKAFAKAVGEELRRAREARGWSRGQMVQRLLSRIGERTLLAYEHGLRQLTMLRLAELADTLAVDAPTVYARGLQQTRLYLDNLTLHVDLRELLVSRRNKFRSLMPWARNMLADHPTGIVEVEPASLRRLGRSVLRDRGTAEAGGAPSPRGDPRFDPA